MDSEIKADSIIDVTDHRHIYNILKWCFEGIIIRNDNIYVCKGIVSHFSILANTQILFTMCCFEKLREVRKTGSHNEHIKKFR